MQKIRVPQTSFAFGEISRATMARTDTPVYQASVQVLKNAYLLSGGGLKRRGGHKRIYDFDITQDTSKTFQARLLPFIYSDDEQYIVSLEDAQVRIFYYDQSNDTLTLATTLTQDSDAAALPFDHDYLHEYTYAQSGDVMFICHPLFLPRQLVRTGLNAFQIEKFDFDQRHDGKMIYQPYTRFHASDVTLDAAATSGSTVSVTVSESYFDTSGGYDGSNYPDSKHIGIVLQIYDNEATIVSVQSSTEATVSIQGTLTKRLTILNPFRTRQGKATFEVTHLNHGFEGGETVTITESDDADSVTAANIRGDRTVGDIIDDNTYVLTAGAGTFDNSEDFGGKVVMETHAPTRDWGEQAFSELRGYPAAVCFHENRLCFGGTLSQPDAIWMSKTGSFYNFDVDEAADNDAIALVGTANEVHEIRYMLSSRDLQVFAASAEMYIPSYLNESITPTNAQLRTQTPYGSAFVEPHALDGATIFVQNGKAAAREYIYTDSEDAYTSTDISTIASDLMGDMKEQTVCHGLFAGNESFSLMTTSSGSCLLFTSNRGEQRAGWSQFEMDGTIHSLVALNDKLFGAVWYDTGTTELVLGEFRTDHRLDCSKTYTASSGIIDLSADFANGEVVYAIESGSYLGSYTIDSGQIDVSGETSETSIEVGKAFWVTVESNPIDAQLNNGPQTGEFRGVSSVVVDLENTVHCTVNGRPFNPSAAYTGKKQVYLLGYDRDPKVTFGQTKPVDLQINGFISELSV